MNTFGAAPELDWADNLLITMPDAVWAQRVAFDPFDLTLSWPVRAASWLWSLICRIAALFGR
jgi:hypothetical protein